MNKRETILTLEQFQQQVEDSEDEFITLYFKNQDGSINDLRWCRGVDDTIEEVEKLDSSFKMALQFDGFDCFIDEYNKPRFGDDEE